MGIKNYSVVRRIFLPVLIGLLTGGGIMFFLNYLLYTYKGNHFFLTVGLVVAGIFFIIFYGNWLFSLIRYRSEFTKKYLRVSRFYFWATLIAFTGIVTPFISYYIYPEVRYRAWWFEYSPLAILYLGGAVHTIVWLIWFYLWYHHGVNILFYFWHKNPNYLEDKKVKISFYGGFQEKAMAIILLISGIVMVVGPLAVVVCTIVL